MSLSLFTALLVAAAATAQQQLRPASVPKVADDRLAAIFAGGEPESVDELRAMQDHVQALIASSVPSIVDLGGATGVLIDGGYVLTAGHVTREADRNITIRLHDGRELEGRTLGANRRTDTGLIRIVTAGEFPTLPLGESGSLRRGQWCLMFGHASGAKRGRSAPARYGRVLRPAGERRTYVTTDCPMQGGDSGGPLLDMDGRLIGINSRIANDVAINMHVPIDAFRAEWNELVAGNVVEAPRRRGRGPRLGVRWDREADDARVREIVSGSVAERAGLLAGDVVLEVDGAPIEDRRAAGRAIGRRERQQVTLRVHRGDESIDLVLDFSSTEDDR